MRAGRCRAGRAGRLPEARPQRRGGIDHAGRARGGIVPPPVTPWRWPCRRRETPRHAAGNLMPCG